MINNKDLNGSVLKIKDDDLEFITKDGVTVSIKNVILNQDNCIDRLNKKVDKFEYKSWLTLAVVLILAVPVGSIALNRDALIIYQNVIKDQNTKLKDQDVLLQKQTDIINDLENRIIKLESK